MRITRRRHRSLSPATEATPPKSRRSLRKTITGSLGVGGGNNNNGKLQVCQASSSTSGAGLAGSNNKRRTKFNEKLNGDKPTELFRTDYISAMKTSDVEALNAEHELILLTDPWRQEWNVGVQVPISEYGEGGDEEPAAVNCETFKKVPDAHDRFIKREPGADEARSAAARYELDDLDVRWLKCLNSKFSDSQGNMLDEELLEQTIERLEFVWAVKCVEVQQSDLYKRQQADADAVCDVCRDEISEEGNLLVFCERCNVCVHQACYGVRRVPVGPWLCRPCALDVRPSCILCPNRGGALKPTRSGERWAHVSCAVWIPEIEFGNPALKEPIMRVCRVPEERWTLRCQICDQRAGACIQCDVKKCHASYHVTCAQRAGWRVTYKESLPDDRACSVLQSFCKKHGRKTSRDEDADNESEDHHPVSATISGRLPSDVAYRLLVGMRYTEIEHAFEGSSLPVWQRRAVFHYWRVKRLASPFKGYIIDLDHYQLAAERERQAEFLYRRVDGLIALRQTMEKTRTLCYMVEKREKLKRQWVSTAVDQVRLVIDDLGNTKAPPLRPTEKARLVRQLRFEFSPRLWIPRDRRLHSLIGDDSKTMEEKLSSEPEVVKRKRGRRPKNAPVRPLVVMNAECRSSANDADKHSDHQRLIGTPHRVVLNLKTPALEGKRHAFSTRNADILSLPDRRKRTRRSACDPF